MTWGQIKGKIHHIIYYGVKRNTLDEIMKSEGEEAFVYFDFPLIPGGPNKFKIADISERGIMIRNDSVDRPAGHP